MVACARGLGGAGGERGHRTRPGCRSRSSPAAPCRAARRRRSRCAAPLSETGAGTRARPASRTTRRPGRCARRRARAAPRRGPAPRSRRREQAEVALARDVGQLQQLRLALQGEPVLPVGIGLLGERLVLRVRARQRRRAAGAALVDEDDVAPVVEPAEERHRRCGRRRSRSAPARRRAGTPGRRTCAAPSPERRRSGSRSAARSGCAGSSGRCSVPQRTPLRMPATWHSASADDDAGAAGGVGSAAPARARAQTASAAPSASLARPDRLRRAARARSPPTSFAQGALQLTAGHEPLELARRRRPACP